MFLKCISLVSLILVNIVCADHKSSRSENESKRPTNASDRHDESKQLETYLATCHKLRGMADWMNVAFRVKSLMSRSASERKRARLQDPSNTTEKDRAQPEMSLRRREWNKSGNDSCDSLKNLYSSAQTYVQWQTELMKTKALLGGNAVKSRMTKLNNTPSVIERLGDRLPPIAVLNRTSTEILDGLKVATKALAISLEEQRKRALNLMRNAGKSIDFVRYLGSIKDGVVFRLNNLVETNENLRKAQNFLSQGELMKTFSKYLDRDPDRSMSKNKKF